MKFATISSIQADLKDLRLVEQACRRLHMRTKDEFWAEAASIAREQRDIEAGAWNAQPWVVRAFNKNKEVGIYGREI